MKKTRGVYFFLDDDDDKNGILMLGRRLSTCHIRQVERKTHKSKECAILAIMVLSLVSESRKDDMIVASSTANRVEGLMSKRN